LIGPTIKRKSVSIATTGAVRASAVSRRAIEAVDRVLAGDPRLVARSLRSTPARQVPHGAAKAREVVKVVLPASRMAVSKSGWSRRAE
jgi:hypothetical protein